MSWIPEPDLAPPQDRVAHPLDGTAERYVRLVLALGRHDQDYVDAYYGPPAWRAEVERDGLDLAAVRARATELEHELSRIDVAAEPEIVQRRHAFQRRQLEALLGRLDLLAGRRLSFDEESRLLYDVVTPSIAPAEIERTLAEVDRLLPGESPLAERYEQFQRQLDIPAERVEAVVRAAIDECRRRTAEWLELPAGESFRLELVKEKSWHAYNWYEGGFRSLIQVNTDLPTPIGAALRFGCHEGYPGHHVYNLLLERHLVRERGWVEFAVYPLHSPQSLIAEGTADFAIDVAFPGDEKLRFERERLYPLAGLDPALAARADEIGRRMRRLSFAGDDAARRYLDGAAGAQETAAWLVRTTLRRPAEAAQSVRFFDQYRSYVVNYNVGRDLVCRHIESLGGTEAEPRKRWELFIDLLSAPLLPSDLLSSGRSSSDRGPSSCDR